MARIRYQRVLLKITGEAFCRPDGRGIDGQVLDQIAGDLAEVAKDVQLAIVAGGGNFLRGAVVAEQTSIQPATADYMGMLGTVINAIALQDALEACGRPTRVLSALGVDRVCEPFIRRRCVRHLEKGRVVILAAGTGNPFVTTDTCAALRAVEISAEVLLKATRVDGVYDRDPEQYAGAKRFSRLTYQQAIDQRLQVMDVSAFDLCQRHNVPIVVFELRKPGNLAAVLRGDDVGTHIGGE
jgi:uridylate kinase